MIPLEYLTATGDEWMSGKLWFESNVSLPYESKVLKFCEIIFEYMMS